MRAIILEKFGGVDSLIYKHISEPAKASARGGSRSAEAPSPTGAGRLTLQSLSAANSDSSKRRL